MSFRDLSPDIIVDRVEHLTFDALQKLGGGTVKAVAFDVDGTLMSYHEHGLEPGVMSYLDGLRRAGVRVFIISNAYLGRVKELHELFGDKFVVVSPSGVYVDGKFTRKRLGSKPKTNMLKEAMRIAGLRSGEKIAMVGDQLFKDVLSGSRLEGAISVLVSRRGKGDFVGIRLLQRPLEAVVRVFLRNVPARSAKFPEKPTRVR